MLEDPSCAPNVTPGHQYDASAWYKTTTPNTVMTMFRHDVAQGWVYWTDLATLPVTTAWTQKTGPHPAGAAEHRPDRLGHHHLRRRHAADRRLLDGRRDPAGPGHRLQRRRRPAPRARGRSCRSTHPSAASTPWSSRTATCCSSPAPATTRTAFAAGTFTTAVYHPKTGTFTNVPTPADLFCAGHVQLSDGRVLIMGGNKDYPAADGSHGYKGLKDSYIFDPATNAYTAGQRHVRGLLVPVGDGDGQRRRHLPRRPRRGLLRHGGHAVLLREPSNAGSRSARPSRRGVSGACTRR